jgi:hypothetical protein
MGDLQLKTGPALRVVREFARSIFATICAGERMSIVIFGHWRDTGNRHRLSRLSRVTQVTPEIFCHGVFLAAGFVVTLRLIEIRQDRL